MAGNRLSELTISYVKRAARARGPTSSEAWNDNSDELVRDLTAIYNEWNNFLIPLLDLLPDSDDGSTVDAFTNGLDGRSMFVNATSSVSSATNYFNESAARANTIYEQFQSVYTYIDTQVTTVQEQVDSVALAASDIPVVDSGDLFTATNVETALQELMNLIASTGADHGSLSGLADDDHSQYMPRSGSRPMTGSFSMNANAITDISSVTIEAGGGVLCDGGGIIFGFIGYVLEAGGVLSFTDSGALSSTLGAYSFTDTSGTAPVGRLLSGRQTTLVASGSSASAETASGTLYYNTGALGLHTQTLPSVGNGLRYFFSVMDADGIKVTATGGAKIRIGTSLSIANGSIQATALGTTIELVCLAGEWVAISGINASSWTVT